MFVQHFATRASAAASFVWGTDSAQHAPIAVGQIGRESRFTVKRSICLSNGGRIRQGHTGRRGHCAQRPEGLLITYVCSEMSDLYVELNYRDRHVPPK